MNTVRVLLSTLAFAVPVLCQQTWKVDCNGAPGSHFTDLPAAVAAASPGDTLLVYVSYGTGSCSYYTAPTITKPLSIVGFWTGLSPGNNQTPNVNISGPLVISGIGPGEKLLITSLAISHSMFAPPGSPITVTDCQGTVVFEDLYYTCMGMVGQVVRFERCSNVVLRGCEFDVGGAPIEFIDTTAQLTTTKVLSAAPSPWWGYPYTRETLYLLRSRVTVVGSKVEGPWYTSVGYGPGPAAVLEASTLRIGATSIVHGGYMGPPPWGGYWWTYSSVGPYPSVVEKDPRAPTFVNFPPGPTPTTIDETFHDWVVADELFQVRTYGPPGGTAMLFVGDMLPPRRFLNLGILGVEPSTAILLDTVPLSTTTGFYQWTMFCPSWVPVGHAFALQCLTISPTGVLGLTEPSPVLVGWEKDRLP